MQIFIVDVETDNVKPQLANIMEMGMASLDLGTGKIELLFDTLIHPPGLELWTDCWFMQHSGVDPELIRKAPAFIDIKTGVEAYLTLGPVTAFNLSFDLQVLKKHDVHAFHTWPCLMLTTKDILKLPGRYGDWKYPKFSEAWSFFFPDTPLEDSQRAGSDALHEATLAFALYQKGYFNRKVK
jgi:hypothetical protein